MMQQRLCWLLLQLRQLGAALGCCCSLTWTCSYQQQQEKDPQAQSRWVEAYRTYLLFALSLGRYGLLLLLLTH
jgi:hypothetical protein